MRPHICFNIKSPFTDVALEWFVSSMNSLVILQVPLPGKRLPTISTPVLLWRVGIFVLLGSQHDCTLNRETKQMSLIRRKLVCVSRLPIHFLHSTKSILCYAQQYISFDHKHTIITVLWFPKNEIWTLNSIKVLLFFCQKKI